jgi:antibiotic biosynthesis monooxygenase (ABM) superfamily enzyme
MDKNLNVEQAVELIRLKVLPENVAAFLEGRAKVDEFASTIKGYVGTEILKANEIEYLMLIRWESEEAVKEAQKITATSSLISDWINQTAQFVAFETSISKYEH